MIRVLHFSAHNENCGIGKYQEQFLTAMHEQPKVIYNEFFPYSPHVTKNMSHASMTKVLAELALSLKEFDVLHIQHEFSFFLKDELYRIVKQANDLHKRVIITVHTAPEGHYKKPSRGGLGPRSMLHHEREKIKFNRLEEIHVKPMKLADLILVHNMATKLDLIKHGIDSSKIKVIVMPVPIITKAAESFEISQKLNKKPGDIIYSTIGFISRSKGVAQSIKALNYLPKNYKLAIIGGTHPSGHGEEYLNELCDLIAHFKLQSRVYITGFEPDDDRLNAMIRECDVCVYPYDRAYYNYVSSAALNNSLANGKPTLTYPTGPFVEINKNNTLAITKSSSYYELARTLQQMDSDAYAKAAAIYAETYSYSAEARNLIKIYQDINAGRALRTTAV